MTAPLPILQVLVSMKPGGGPRHVETLVGALPKEAFTTTIAGPHDGRVFDAFRAAGLEVVAVPTNRIAVTPLVRLVRLVRQRRIRVVHSHGKGAGLYGRVAARLTGTASVHTFHGIHFERYPAPLDAAYLALERRLSRWTSAIVNLTAAQEAEGLALRLFERSQSHVIPNGVDLDDLAARALDRAAARRKLELDADAPVVGCAARFDPVKRLDVLVEAMTRVPRATLVLVGDGPEQRRLQDAARAAGIGERVRFPGELADAWTVFPAFDVYVSTSAKEGMPLAILESMALGVPVVARRIAAHEETLGENAPELVDGTPAAIAGAITTLLADPARRRAAGARNHARVRERFDARQMGQTHARLYGALVGL